MAMTAIELAMDPEIIDKARKEFNERLKGRIYKSLIPDTVKPPKLVNRETMDRYRSRLESHFEEL